MHQQARASLLGRPVPYGTPEGLEQVMLFADEAGKIADEIMSDREFYFLLKGLAQQRPGAAEPGSPGVIVEVGPVEAYFHVEMLCGFRHCRKPAFDLAVGQRVWVRFKQIDPFTRTLRFDIAPLESPS
jgi:hypothetical protein